MVNKYGPEHRALRRRMMLTAVGSPCVRCGGPIRAGDSVDLDHTDDGGAYLGMAHAACNRSAGAVKGNRLRGRNRHMDLELRGTVAGCDIARDRSRTAVVIAGWTTHPTEGEVVAASLHLIDGPAALDQLAAVIVDQDTAVAVNGLGHMRAVADSLRTMYQVIEAKASDAVDANARLLDTIRARRLKIPHPHPDLTAAVQFAKVRPLVEGQALDKRGAERDLSPLAALELAVWLLLSREQLLEEPAIY